jgi:hypothetical protein
VDHFRHLDDPSSKPSPERGWSPQPDGRIGRGWRLLGQTWRFLLERPRLMALPALSMLLTTVAAVLLFVPVFDATKGLDVRLSAFIAAAASALPFTFIATFFNVGFLAMVLAAERGEQPTIRDGLRSARRRLRPIVAWSIVSATIGTAISAIEHLPFVGEIVGRVLSSLGGLAWAVATLFVVPVLALDGVGPKEALGRSATAFRRRWGESLTGEITIGAVSGIAIIPGAALICLGIGLLEDGGGAGVGLLVAGIALAAPVLALASAVTELFLLELYRVSVDPERTPGGPFERAQLEAALVPRELPWWRR